jgi:CSLREA domain-containing protein
MPRARGVVSGLRSVIIPRVATVAVVGLLVALLAAVGNVQPAYSATITVNTIDDELNSDGDCSLREAVQAANTDTAVDGCAAGSGADTIDVPAGTHTLSISGAGEDANATGDLDITDDLTITGVGTTSTVIDGAGIDRVFSTLSGATVEMTGVTVRNGTMAEGGGIYNSGTATLTDVTASATLAR